MARGARAAGEVSPRSGSNESADWRGSSAVVDDGVERTREGERRGREKREKERARRKEGGREKCPRQPLGLVYSSKTELIGMDNTQSIG